MASKKIIITCAIRGSIHTPSMSPYLPVTAEEIAGSALGAAAAGAAIVHLYARNPVDGRPDQGRRPGRLLSVAQQWPICSPVPAS